MSFKKYTRRINIRGWNRKKGKKSFKEIERKLSDENGHRQ